MIKHLTANRLDWEPILNCLQKSFESNLPTYPGDLKAALINHAGLTNDPRGEEIYKLSVEISRLTTCCDSEVIYWFSRLAALMN
jgi:hypothetical protein